MTDSEVHSSETSVVQKQADEPLQDSEKTYRLLFENMSTGLALYEMLYDEHGNPVDYRFLDANPAFERQTGLSISSIVGRTVLEVLPETGHDRIETCAKVVETGTPAVFEEYWGSLAKWFEARAFSTGRQRFATVFTDITERKQAEAYGEMGREILQILNEPGPVQVSLQRILSTLHEATGFDAVGIRLQDGDDFPYSVQEGLSADFLLTENTLIERKADGGICRDSNGRVSLECTCGLVISGKTNPLNPLFTRGGSFWTNDSFPLLDLTPDEDPRHNPRNRCIRTGYASIALVPIRNRDGIVGLIQLNDHRKGRLTLRTVELLEGIAAHIGEALMRKQAEQALAVSNATLLEAQTIAHIGDWSLDAATRVFVWSDEMYAIHGMQPGIPVPHDTYVELIHPDDRQHVLEVMRSAMEGRQQEFGVDYRIVRPDRSERFVTLMGKTIQDVGRTVTGIRGTMQDITDRKRAEATLQESERRYHLLFDNMTTAFALHEMLYDERGNPVDYRFLEANHAFERLTGLPVASILGHTVLEVLPETEPRWIQTYVKVVQTGTPALFEEYSGAIGKWFETRAFRVAENQFATIFADVTERKRAEQELRESENRFRAVFEQAAVGVALLNTKTGQFVRINRRYCDFLGYTMQEMLQKTFADITFPDDVQQNVEGNAQLMEGSRREFSYEKRYVRKDGSIVWGSLEISPLWKPGEKPTTYFHIAVVQDITDRKRAEEEKEAMQAQLLQSKKLEAVGQLAGGVAHNFNNLLTGILGNIDIARSDLDAAHPASPSLDTARATALRAASLARQLSSFARNAMVLPVVQNANSAVQVALELVCSSLPSSIGVIRDLSPDAWDVEVDPSQLTQVLLDLANNAREAMDDRGSISVRTRNVTVDATYVATTPFARTGEFVVISVADTGPGIDPAMLPRLFEPFATTKLFGRGMGLATALGALRQAGGWVAIGSEPGAGTRIDLYLPRHVEGSPPSA
jgi:PAS domain S-box-containing protein